MYMRLILTITLVLLGTDPGDTSPIREDGGIEDFIQKDNCFSPMWTKLNIALQHAILLTKERRFKEAVKLVHAVSDLRSVLGDPRIVFTCGAASASVSLFLANCYEALGDPLRSLRLRQAASLYASYDLQMMGKDWLEKSGWGIRWEDTVDASIRSMTWFASKDTLRNTSMSALTRSTPASSLNPESQKPMIAIVTVCDYDADITPLERLSHSNKEKYSRSNGYDLYFYNQAPVYRDFFTDRADMYKSRPHAWSKLDALLITLTSTEKEYDWIMWMDCDSYFMDPVTTLEDVIRVGQHQHAAGNSLFVSSSNISARLARLREWSSDSPFDNAKFEFESQLEISVNEELLETQKMNPGMLHAPLHMIASEDGLMLNTGIFLLRRSVKSFAILWRTRSLLFNRSAITFHPWWEQTALMMLLTVQYALDNNSWPLVEANAGFAPYCHLMSQKQLNGYPPLIAGMLKTHAVFTEGDFIVSFSGCKTYTSQSVCNNLFMDYYMRSPFAPALGT